MARVIVSAVVGVAVGVFTGNPYLGFQAGALTYGATGFLDPAAKIQGPRLDDTKGPQANEGAPIPYMDGVWRTAGTYIWCSDKHEIATETNQGGKGGPGVDTTTYTYTIDVLILFTINEMDAIRRVWSNGKLVWSAASDDLDSLEASANTDSWEEMRFYTGALDQMPDPDYEAAVGVGNAPAYRGRSSVFIKGLNLGGSGQLPVLNFELVREAQTDLVNLVLFQTRFINESPVDESVYGAVPTLAGEAFIAEEQFHSGSVEIGEFGTATYLTPGLTRDNSRAMTLEFNFSSTALAETTNTLVNMSQEASTEFVRFSYYGTTGNIGFDALDIAPGTYQWVLPDNPEYEGPPHAALVIPAGSPAVYRIYLNGLNVGNIARPNPTFLGDGRMTYGPDGNNDFENDIDVSVWNVRVRQGERYAGNFIPPISLGPPGESEIVTPEVPTLDVVTQRICLRTGLLFDSDIDVTDLYDETVQGISISQGSARQALETLMAAKLFESVETGGIIKFVKRGSDPVLTIPYEDLGASTGETAEPLPVSRANDIELPARIFVRYSNVLNDYQDGSASGDRLVTNSTSTTTTELALAMTPTEAQRVADSQTMDLQVSLVTLGPISVNRKYSPVEPTDVVLVEDSVGGLYRARVQKITDAPEGVRTLDLVVDDSSVINSQVDADETDYSTVLVRAISDTAALYLDGPIARDADDDAGFYIAAKAADATKPWTGSVVYSSNDGLVFTRETAVTERAIFGPCVTVLGDWYGPRVFDETNIVRVNAGGLLTSTTREAMLNNQAVNACAIGVHGRWEYLQFRTASLVSEGIYDLSGLLRGSRGTEWAMIGHQPGETFFLLRPAGMRRVPVENAFIGLERFYKTPSVSKSLNSAATVPFTDSSVGLKPFSPIDARKEDGSDITITWQRRTRLSTRSTGPMGISVPLGEVTEAYSVEILAGDTDDTVLRTINTTTPEAVYTSAMQSTDGYSPGDPLYVKIYQLSAIVGRGYPLEAVL